jgi:A nuclease of the HNH/ENDO VII superfamily with conserved WHH
VDAVTGAVRDSASEQADAATSRIAESGREVLARIQAAEDAVHKKVSEAEASTGGRLAEKDEALRTQVAAVEEAVRAGLGYVWHHVEDGETLMLIPKDLHNAVRHTGGSAVIREQLRQRATEGGP